MGNIEGKLLEAFIFHWKKVNILFLRGLQKHICIISGKSKACKFYSWFLNFERSFLISLDLRSKKLYLSICFEKGSNGKCKMFMNMIPPLKI